MSQQPKRRRRPYLTGRPEIDQAITTLCELLPESAGPRAELARQVATTAIKMVLEESAVGDLKLVNSALKELRWAFKVFGPHRGTRKVSVFGSARTEPDQPAYEQAREFGAQMAARGWGVITGAGDGIMAAAHGGAGRERSFGVNIELPFEQKANKTVRGDQKLVNFKYFFTRKLVFLKETDAIVLFPGGFGTHDEGFEALTLLQTGKADPLPVVFVEPVGSDYWEEWHDYVVRHLEVPGLISPEDTALYKVTDRVEDAIEELERFYRVYHSSRYVGDLLVLRLQDVLADERVRLLERDFGHLIKSGGMEQRPALEEEAGQPEIADLPRLVFHYTRADAAGLRRLIDAINDTPPLELEPRRHVGPDPNEERADRGGTPGPDEPEDLDDDAEIG